MYTDLHILKAMVHSLSPLPPPPDRRRQGNLSRSTINSSRKLFCIHKNSVWHSPRRNKEAAQGGYWENPMVLESDHENRGDMLIFCRLC